MPTPGSELARHIPAGAPAGALDFRQLMKRAEILAESGLVPKALQGNPAGIALVGMRGAELGFSLGYALENIDVIDGKAVPNAQARLTRLRLDGHEARFTESTSERATIRARRKEYRDDPDAWITFTYTIDDARRAGMLDIWVEEWRIPLGGDRKKKCTFAFGDDTGPNPELIKLAPAWAKKLIDAGVEVWRRKDNWQKDPLSMLRAACTRHITRMEFSDVMAGMGIDAHTTDEFDSDVDDYVHTAEPEPPGTAGDDDDDPNITDAEVVGDNQAAETPPPAESGGEASLDDLSSAVDAAGCTQVQLLREARRVAAENNLQPPAAVEEITDPKLITALLGWLNTET